MVARKAELGPHDLRQDSTHQPAHHGEGQIERADVLVVGAAEPTHKESRLVVVMIVGVIVSGRGHQCCTPADATCWRGSFVVSGDCGVSLANFVFACASQALNSCSGTARTTIGMRLWFVPQIWLHSP